MNLEIIQKGRIIIGVICKDETDFVNWQGEVKNELSELCNWFHIYYMAVYDKDDATFGRCDLIIETPSAKENPQYEQIRFSADFAGPFANLDKLQYIINNLDQ